MPENIITNISKICDENTIVVTDVGQHQMWTAQYSPYQNERQLVTSGGLGTMGYGLGASLGAKVGNPDKIVSKHCRRWMFPYEF